MAASRCRRRGSDRLLAGLRGMGGLSIVLALAGCAATGAGQGADGAFAAHLREIAYVGGTNIGRESLPAGLHHQLAGMIADVLM